MTGDDWCPRCSAHPARGRRRRPESVTTSWGFPAELLGMLASPRCSCSSRRTAPVPNVSGERWWGFKTVSFSSPSAARGALQQARRPPLASSHHRPGPGAPRPPVENRRGGGHPGRRGGRGRHRRALCAGDLAHSADAHSWCSGRARARRCRACSRSCSRPCSSSMALPRDLIEQDWFQTIADWNPGLLHDRGNSGIAADGLGRRGARARLRLRGRPGARRSVAASLALDRMAHVSRGGFVSVALAVGWRNAHNYFGTRRWWCRGCCSRCSSSRPSPGGCRGSIRCRDSTSLWRGTRPSSTASCCCRPPRSAASSPASQSRATSSPASPAA